MRKPQNFLKAIPLAMAVCGSILISTAEPASAFGWWKTDYLGRATISDTVKYMQLYRKSLINLNRNDICKFKYGVRSGVYGKAVSSWETNCYRTYWKWWW